MSLASSAFGTGEVSRAKASKEPQVWIVLSRHFYYAVSVCHMPLFFSFRNYHYLFFILVKSIFFIYV